MIKKLLAQFLRKVPRVVALKEFCFGRKTELSTLGKVLLGTPTFLFLLPFILFTELFSLLFLADKASAPKPGMCAGCQQARHRVYLGARTTMCRVCGCYWMNAAAAHEFDAHKPNANRVQATEEFDAKFYEDVRAFRECAEKAGCDMAAFDMSVACRKARVDEFRANAQHFYRQHPGTPSGK